MQQRDEALLQEAMLPEVDRLLHSSTFRHSDALRRLLRFLAEKSLAGEADQLKEYSIALDGLGKPSTYDPRNDSTVRIQVGRLRQKLGEYYRTESPASEWMLDLPKGQFSLTCKPRLAAEALPAERANPVAAVPSFRANLSSLPLVVALLGVPLLISLAWAAYATAALSRQTRQNAVLSRSIWTPELQQLWQPFLTAKRPLLVVIGDPPFVQFTGFGTYRDLHLNNWEDIVKSPEVNAIRKALGNAEMQHSLYYAPIGEVSATFLLGKLLGPRVDTMTLERASELSWQQLADNNVLYIGAQVFFMDRLRGMPVDLDLQNSSIGIQNLHPLPGEPSVLRDVVPPEPFGDGEAHILITRVPGPRGTGDVQSFFSNRTSGRLAAVQWFTDENFARILVEKLRKPSGEIPRYYQVVLKVNFKDGVPTKTSYVLHHELSAKEQPAGVESSVSTRKRP